MMVPESDRVRSLNAIQALLQTCIKAKNVLLEQRFATTPTSCGDKRRKRICIANSRKLSVGNAEFIKYVFPFTYASI